MCGRKFSDEYLSWSAYRDQLDLITPQPATNFAPNWNIAPTHEVPVCRIRDGARHLDLLRWGLLPFWAKDKKAGYSMINAKAETLEEKRSFSPLLKDRRCVIPVSGFFEWEKLDPKGKHKQAWAIKRTDGAPLLLAGLWTDNETLDMETYTVITTAPNTMMSAIHNRMPAILERDSVTRWLEGDWEEARTLAIPAIDQTLTAWKIGLEVGNVRNNFPELLEPNG